MILRVSNELRWFFFIREFCSNSVRYLIDLLYILNDVEAKLCTKIMIFIIEQLENDCIIGARRR